MRAISLPIARALLMLTTRCAPSRPPSLLPIAGNTSTPVLGICNFGKVLSGLITESQGQRIQAALATLRQADR